MSVPRTYPVYATPRPDGADPCHCGAPIPAGRVAYCSPRCRLADMDHGCDYDTTKDAA